jgi:hypothetical protein
MDADPITASAAPKVVCVFDCAPCSMERGRDFIVRVRCAAKHDKHSHSQK